MRAQTIIIQFVYKQIVENICLGTYFLKPMMFSLFLQGTRLTTLKY